MDKLQGKTLPVLSPAQEAGELSQAEGQNLLRETASLAGRRRLAPGADGGGATRPARAGRPQEISPAVGGDGSAARERAPVGERAQVQVRLEELYTWRNEAMAQLHDLAANRHGIGPSSRPLPAAMRSEVQRAARRNLSSLSKNALEISTLEARLRNWTAAAAAARDAIRLRSETAAEVLGQPLRPNAQAHLKLAHDTFMVEGNSPRLREELRLAADANPKSKSIPYWLARYELMVGNYPAAFQAAERARDDPRIQNTILPKLKPSLTAAPQIPFPGNFYTYRYMLANDDVIRKMQQALAELANDEELAAAYEQFLQDPEANVEVLRKSAAISLRAMNALLLWNQGIRDFENRKYTSAARNFQSCQREILVYFSERYPAFDFGVPDDDEEDYHAYLARLAFKLIRLGPTTSHIYTHFRQRYQAVTLEELYEHDWVRPTVVPLAYKFYEPLPETTQSANFGESLILAFIKLGIRLEILKAFGTDPDKKIEEKIDAPLLALALVFTPLGKSEANRMRRNFDPAKAECVQLLRRHQSYKVLSETIEKPFVKMLEAQILLEKGDSEYKARRTEDAAETYRGVKMIFEDQGEYVHRVEEGASQLSGKLDELLQHSFHPLAIEVNGAPPLLTKEERHRFKITGKEVTIPTISAKGTALPGLDRRSGPHENLLTFQPPAGEEVMREENPLIYALIAEAQARLVQIEAGLNYLGYRDDYIPPWRFQFLLDRARYFAEHARNAQREYLSFLTNAEREEFQELNTAQNVVLEKANLRIETARVEQGRQEVEVAQQSRELAQLTAQDAKARFGRYQDFDKKADELSDDAISGANTSAILSTISGAISGAVLGAKGGPIGAIAGGILGGAFGFAGGSAQADVQKAQIRIATEQREFEKFSLSLSVLEAEQAADVSLAQLGAARAALVVAGLQRAAALLRHEFAVQNLAFLRNRTLNAELWYRLSHMIRGVSDTYLRYSVELAFLAEQAYEFEADKRINVVRFDYDVSEYGDFLASDFLLRDLDTLEQDLIVTQRSRQQQVRYVLSLAREFPEALQELRETGATIFPLRLEQLERRFPGLFNLRIGSIEVLPVALMDPTRFSLEVTYLGASQIRLQAQPDTSPGQPSDSPLNTDDLDIPGDWLVDLGDEWPVKIRTVGPETAVYSGLSRTEGASIFQFVTGNQRGAFESLGAAAAWRVDMSMKENQVVPGTLVDLLFTYNLSGYHHPELRAAVEAAPRRAQAQTLWLSARQRFPDALYHFNETARMDWEVTGDMLSFEEGHGRLRNLGMILLPSTRSANFGRIRSLYRLDFRLSDSGQLEILSEIPQMSFAANGLSLVVQALVPGGATISLDFGDRSTIQEGAAQSHLYARPGKYAVGLRVERNDRLFEFRADVVVSRTLPVPPPLTAFPNLAVNAGATGVPPGLFRVEATTQAPGGEALSALWQLIRGKRVEGLAAEFDLAPGEYNLIFCAIRTLNARIYSRQRFDPAQSFPLTPLQARTNRHFDVDGNDVTGVPPNDPANPLAVHLFSAGPLSPSDRWTLELLEADNPFLLSVTSSDQKVFDLSEIDDAILALEYEIDI